MSQSLDRGPSSGTRPGERCHEAPRPPRLDTRQGQWLMRVALLGLLGLAVLGAELPDVHTHDAETPGLYNEECPLVRLAVPAWGLTALARDTLPEPDPASDPAAAPTPGDLPAAPRPAFAARAPPASS
jgi:hypothetical protein